MKKIDDIGREGIMFVEPSTPGDPSGQTRVEASRQGALCGHGRMEDNGNGLIRGC